MIPLVALLALAAMPAAQAAPRDEVISRVAVGIAQLRSAAGPNWRVKGERADRILAGMATAGDLMALGAEAAARGKGETTVTLAALFASRRDRYIIALAMLDGNEIAGLARLDAGDDGDAVLTALDTAIADALVLLPARE